MIKQNSGFTLIEILVALFVFSLVIGGAVNLLLSSISAQNISLLGERILQEHSSLAEYMGRALRQAIKDLAGNCIPAGTNYELINGGAGIRFMSHDGLCEQFFLSGSAAYEQKSTNGNLANFGAQVVLTSANVSVDALHFALSGESQADLLQPRLTFFVQMAGIQLQTTVSQRNFDVQQ